jgi:hypothetical protein
MKKATSLDMELPRLRPGIRVKTTPADYQPIDGKGWRPVGAISSE